MFVPPPGTLPSSDMRPLHRACAAYLVKFIRNALAWRWLLSNEAVLDIVLADAVSKRVLAALNTCTDTDVCMSLLVQTVQALPQDWMSDTHRARNAIKRHLEPFAAFLTRFARGLQSAQHIGTVVGALNTLGEHKKAEKLQAFLQQQQQQS